MKTTIEIFWKKECPGCHIAIDVGKKLQEEGYRVKLFNVEDLDGLTESTFHTIMSTPSILIVDEEDNTIKEWRSEIPAYSEITEELEKLKL